MCFRLPAHVLQLSQLLPVSTCQAPAPTAVAPAVPSTNGAAWNGMLFFPSSSLAGGSSGSPFVAFFGRAFL